MSDGSAIEWTDATWNPVRGCEKISAGCKNCYAATFAERWRGVPGHAYEYGFDFRLAPQRLEDPLRWRRPRKIFVNSMSDLFLAKVPDSYIVRVFDVMQRADWHTHQVLTKRPERMQQLLSREVNVERLDHIWMGVSVENRKHGVPRIAELRATRAAVRFLSIEPLLEDLGTIDLTGVHWVIAGGESGPRARPIEEAWILSILQQCREARVPFFFKQWGGVNKKIAGRKLRGRTYSEFPKCSRITAQPRLPVVA